jgi:hypothetical protein
MDTSIIGAFARFSCSLFNRTGKSIVVIGVVSCLAATGLVAAMTGAGIALGGQPEIVSVERSHKGDRLVMVPKHTSTASPRAVTTVPQLPMGCEAAFSRVADPQRAHIFGRCIS